MTWEDLPAGLVDAFRQEAFSLKGEGILIVRLSRGSFRVSSQAGSFFAKLYDRLDDLIRHQTKSDVLVMVGRVDKAGAPMSPQVQIREFGV